jgi:TatD DNase family protein
MGLSKETLMLRWVITNGQTRSMLIDTHAHLQLPHFKTDIEKVLGRARKVGVECIVNVGFDLEGTRQAIELAKTHEGLYATVGIHPHNATELNDKVLETLRNLSRDTKVVAIGEIGLDYYRNLSPKHVQRKAFETQMELAEKLELPVVIHNRDAHADIIEVVSRFSKMKGIMHCFSGSSELAKQCMRLGFFISFAGPVTYQKSQRLQDIASWIELERVLVETDCPWLSPEEVRGKRNEPANLVYTVRKIARLRGVSFHTVAEATTVNARKLLQL